MQEPRRSYLLMHIATFLFGFTAILGKLINLGELNLVWHRMWLASFIFMLFPSFWRKIKQIPKKRLLLFFGNGVLVAIHWYFFYGCIKVGNSASLALACFGTVATFSALLEPLIMKTRFKKSEIALGILVLVGLFFISKANPGEQWSIKSNYFLAIVYGLIAAFIAALFSVINRKYIENYSPTVTTWAQMSGGFLFLSLCIPFFINSGMTFEWIPQLKDIGYLLILSALCTNVAFSFEMEALKNISAFTSNLILNLEPVYGIILALVIFHEYEILNQWFYIGTILITLSVFLHPLMNRKKTTR